jgi:uncharacterized membrane protein YphA (DoxX/SURF4 family)
MFETPAEPRNIWGDWLLRGGVGVCFLYIGWGKFSPSGEWVTIFQHIGLGQWFRYVTGVVEMLGGALVLIPRLAIAGYGLLAVTMFGAAVADLAFVNGIFAIIPGGLFFFLAGCCLSRWNS